MTNALTGEALATIALPGWIYAGAPYSCFPDLALGPRGEAVVTSDVVPVLWRIDPETFAVTRQELVLDNDGGRDVGFSAIAWSPRDGSFFAASGIHGSLWRIDPLLRRAQQIPVSEPLRGACELGVRTAFREGKANRLHGLCVRSTSHRQSVDLAPDRRAAWVRVASCSY